MPTALPTHSPLPPTPTLNPALALAHDPQANPAPIHNSTDHIQFPLQFLEDDLVEGVLGEQVVAVDCVALG